jgi:hypothetical protein
LKSAELHKRDSDALHMTFFQFKAGFCSSGVQIDETLLFRQASCQPGQHNTRCLELRLFRARTWHSFEPATVVIGILAVLGRAPKVLITTSP